MQAAQTNMTDDKWC